MGNMTDSMTRISIHAPRTGSDLSITCSTGKGRYFNPRSPYGERLRVGGQGTEHGDFNPRSPYGERRRKRFLIPLWPNFNPRSPYGERLVQKP